MKTKKKEFDMRLLQKPVILLTVILIMTVLRPAMFLKPSNVSSIFLAISIYGIIACGAIYPLLIGGIDLSIGSICALSGCTTILLVRFFNYELGGTIFAIVVGLFVGVLCGVLNGFVSCNFAIPAFVVTLAMKNIVLGIAQRITNKNTVACLNSDLVTWIGTGHIFGIPVPIIIFAIIVVITWFILNKTVFGRRVYSVGGNPIASRFTGINSKMIQVTCYALSGFAAGIGGIVLSCFNNQCIATQGSGYDGDVLMALVVGGVSLAGGEGSILGGVFGLVLIGILDNAITLLGIDSIYKEIITGAVVIIAVAIDMHGKFRNNGMERKIKIFSKKEHTSAA